MSDTLISIVHIIACIILIGIVLLQRGKGAEAGAAFGGGGQTFFGASGAGNILTRITTCTAILFMVTSVTLAVLSKRSTAGEGEIFKNIEAPQAPDSPPLTSDVTDTSTAPAQMENAEQTDKPTEDAALDKPLEASAEAPSEAAPVLPEQVANEPAVGAGDGEQAEGDDGLPSSETTN